MNLFVLDRSPRIAAQFLCDAHVVKMILESAQLLSTQDRLNGLERGYRMTHENHPCRRCLENPANYLWLSAHLGSLLREYTHRFRKEHRTEQLFRLYWKRDFRCMSGGAFAKSSRCRNVCLRNTGSAAMESTMLSPPTGTITSSNVSLCPVSAIPGVPLRHGCMSRSFAEKTEIPGGTGDFKMG